MAYDADLEFLFQCPTRIVFGMNKIEDLSIELENLKVNKALVVTDQGIIENTPCISRVEKALGDKCAGIFSDVPPDSSVETVETAAAFAKAQGAEGLISVGGGSVIDTTKGMAIILTEGGKLKDHQGVQNLTRRLIPHISIPTTAGTGSEVTNAVVVLDPEDNQKLLFWDNHVMPDVAILDPEATRNLPAKLTAATGMDALSHCLEAIHGQQRHPIADAQALYSIGLIGKYLELAVKDGDDMFARGQMSIAAMLAGIAFASSSVGLIHAIAHTVGAHHRVHHGLANSIAMPPVIRFNADTCPDCYAMAARAMGLAPQEMGDQEATEALAQGIYDLAGRIGLPQKYRDTGVPEDALEVLAEATLWDGAIVYNPKFAMDVELLLPVYREAW